ncbi:GIY-YIG nuclease family protein [Pseudomonas sp. gcc21]|uniref:GIY-YIG nuclease family protein n=1 Tax=Pseudomonas sp. gcc21 TaxID=2726989 RepID=UPI001451F201|nr:GIY-YIG nuclease family protein [Pseudomonas sp. gcc21]QJD60348.1 GIY-YIG nuclease family protein [Pseudomonas sp. gcc21]
MPSESTQHTLEPAARTWWVYMVRAENGHLYTGISTDPQRRFRQHASGKGARFFNRSPAQALVWQEICIDHSDALRRELAVKALAKPAKEKLIRLFADAEAGTDTRLNRDCAADPAPAKLD